MATYRDGNVRKATPNSRSAARRSAENRRCPKCKRKSAMVHFSNEDDFGSQCRWCGHTNRIVRDAAVGDLRYRDYARGRLEAALSALAAGDEDALVDAQLAVMALAVHYGNRDVMTLDPADVVEVVEAPEPVCICSPEQRARGGWRSSCPVDHSCQPAKADARPWCGAPRELGGQQPCPLTEPCDAGTCRVGSKVGSETYAPASRLT